MTYRTLEEFERIIGTHSIFSIRAALSPLLLSLSWQTPDQDHPVDLLFLAHGRDGMLAIDENKYIAIATDKIRDCFTGNVSVNELKEEYFLLESQTRSLYEEVTSKDISGLTPEEVPSYFEKVDRLFTEAVNRTLYIENVDYDKVLFATGDAFKGKLDLIWERATEAAFISFEARRLEHQIQLIESHSYLPVRESKYAFTDYFWPKDDAYIEQVLTDIREHMDEKKKEVEQAHTGADARQKAHEAWTLTLDPESRNIADYLQFVMHCRDLRKDPLAQLQALMAELSVRALNDAGIAPKHAPYVVLYEYLRGNAYLSAKKDEIEHRSDGCLYLVRSDRSCEVEPVDFDAAFVAFTQMIESKMEKSSSLKGQIACRGIKVGVARVIFDPHDDRGFQPGDILITSMTRPEFVPIMKKAGAVVTNEGGITCHAAIVSRELGIPCVIGTKTATHMFKDGDMVEVDANAGTVRKV